MFERFTERSREVLRLAQQEARSLRHGQIGTEHLLLGLMGEEEGRTAQVLNALGVTVERARAQVVLIVGTGEEEITIDRIPFTPRAKKVLELALRDALSLGHNYIGPEHILLGLVRENEGVGARVLADFDVGPGKVRDKVIQTLPGPSRPRRAAQAERRNPGYEAIRAGLGMLRLRHVEIEAIRGILMSYDFDNDVCEIELETPGLQGRLKIARTRLTTISPTR